MARYVDGFVIPVPKKNLGAYQRVARAAGRIWKKYGALEYLECVGDDLNIRKVMPFPRGIRAKANEVILFSWIVYNSRKHRDQVNAKVMKDPRILKMMAAKPLFDSKRMLYGGFRVIVDL